jgi:fused signal recognition particle receptor
MSLINRFRNSLTRTRENFADKLGGLFSRYPRVDDNMWDELEDILISADVGVVTTMKLLESVRRIAKDERISSTSEIHALLKGQIDEILSSTDLEGEEVVAKPYVILIVGVNGVGKTTSIAKLAYRYKSAGKKVLLAAADTFRAAAIDQISIWGERVGAPVIRHQEGSDPAAVVYDAMQAAKARDVDVLIVDTAGRLHTKVNLMEELKKVRRIINREMDGAPHETLIVLDATTGQNGIHQVEVFHSAVPLSGIILTKLDGTAKGGIVVAVKDMMNIPIRYVGTGEKLDDLALFDATEFSHAMFE